jgi:hypothetical protein
MTTSLNEILTNTVTDMARRGLRCICLTYTDYDNQEVSKWVHERWEGMDGNSSCSLRYLRSRVKNSQRIEYVLNSVVLRGDLAMELVGCQSRSVICWTSSADQGFVNIVVECIDLEGYKCLN